MLQRSLKDLIKVELNNDTLASLSWKEFSNGLSMARLARAGEKELVLYRVQADAAQQVFLRHEHVGGEFFLVLKGEIEDENGVYKQGDLVYLEPQSVHTPRGLGETIVLVLWPAGVRILE
jgi:anti-sigma factor ChrR (cupin superfamily)